MTTTPARDALYDALTTGTQHAQIRQHLIDAHAAEVRAAALNEAEQVLRSRARHTEDGCDFCNGVDFAADAVRDLAAAARPDNTPGAHRSHTPGWPGCTCTHRPDNTTGA